MFVMCSLSLSLSTTGCRRCNTADGELAADFTASQLCNYRPYKVQTLYLIHVYGSFKSDCLGCAVLLCLVVCLTLLATFFFPSHLSLTCTCTRIYMNNRANVQAYMYVFVISPLRISLWKEVW